MIMKKIFLCEDSIDGIFTAIYLAYSSRYGHANCKLETRQKQGSSSNLELFSEYIEVETDYELAQKVAKALKEKVSEEAYRMACSVALSDQEGKEDLIYRFMILCFSMGRQVLEHLSNDIIIKMFKIDRYVGKEAHHLLGFVRFSEQEEGLLLSVIHPKNNVITMLADHFADRLPKERFVIFDENRRLAALHVPGKPWILTQLSDVDVEQFQHNSRREDDYGDLWRIFFKSISIKERENYKLQRNNLPIRFRGDMTEFQK